MRAFWIIYGSLDQLTGGYIYDRLILEGAPQAGVSVQLCSIEPGSAPQPLCAYLERSAPDVIVGDGLCLEQLAPAYEHVRGLCPRLLLLHHLTRWEGGTTARRLRGFERRVLAEADGIITTSAATAARLQGDYPATCAQVVCPGSDRLTRVPGGRAEQRPLRLLFVGQLIARKGVIELLDAFEEVGATDVELRLIGDGRREAAYAATVAGRIARSPYLRGHVQVLGPVSDAELAEQYAGAAALVLPSSLEGYGMVLTEALWAGLPVLASRAGVIERSLLRLPGVMPLDCGTRRGLVTGLAYFFNDEALRRRLKDAAVTAHRELPTWAAAGERFWSLAHDVSADNALRRA